MTIFRSAARNISIVIGSHALMWVATLAFTVAQAHLLGPALFGALSLAISLSLFLTVVIDFGLGIQLSRMVAQRTADVDALVATIVLRVAMWLVAVPVLMLVTVALGYDAELAAAILILAVSVLFVGINASIEAFLRGHERFVVPSIGSVVYRLTAAAVGIALLLAGQGIVIVAIAFLVGAAANLGVLLFGIGWEVWRRATVDLRLATRLFRAAVPLGLWWMIAAFCFSTDIVIMQLRAPAENVGWYAAAYRLFNVATIFPQITVGFVLAPVFSRLSLGPREDLRRVLERSLAVLIICGIGVALVLAVFAEGIIAAVYPADAYGPAANALRLLAPRIAFLYVNSAILYALIGLHQERRLLRMAIAFAILTPLANLAVIPLLQQDGAAIVSSATELCWLIWLGRALPADLLTRGSALLGLKAGVAAAMAAVVGLALAGHSLLIAVPLTLVAYGASLIAVGAIGRSELAALRGLAQREPATVRSAPVPMPAVEEVA